MPLFLFGGWLVGWLVACFGCFGIKKPKAFCKLIQEAVLGYRRCVLSRFAFLKWIKFLVFFLNQGFLILSATIQLLGT